MKKNFYVKKQNMATYENRLLFEKQLEIPIGQNTLTVVATDINGGITEKVQESFALRRESIRLLELAKTAVEVAIEQGEDKAMELLTQDM